MNLKRLVILFVSVYNIFGISPKLMSQNTDTFVFGKISPSDFTINSPLLDSGIAAVVLADVGFTNLDGYEYGFRTVFTRSRRIKILNKNGFRAANIALYFSISDNDKGRLKSLKATTYNLEDGKVVATPLGTGDCFLDNPDEDIEEEKFTFPNVKAGSIIEYTFTVKSSRIFKLQSWDFQGEYPVLWSDYTVRIPELFNYVVMEQGYQPVFKKMVDSIRENVGHGSVNEESTVYSTRWIMKDVPALKEEPFTSTLENHIARVQFQMSTRTNNITREQVMTNWNTLTDRLLHNEYFGNPISINNHWLRKDLDKITEGCVGETDKAKKIFAFVRDNFTVTEHSIYMRSAFPLKEVFRKRNGSVAEVNLLLIAMLRQDDIKADPLILSTRDNGLTNIKYPIIENFNYVIVRAIINEITYYLDASEPKLGFGKLPIRCYNGQARLIATTGSAVFFSPDSLKEFKNTTVFVSNDSGSGMSGFYTSTKGYYESLQLRNELVKSKISDVYKTIALPDSSEIVIDSLGIDSLQQYEQPVCVHYNMKFNIQSSNILYFNPLFNEGIKENPFKSARRLYPVEMPHLVDEIYVLNMEIPKGYKVDELPKSVKVKLNETDGSFEYSIAVVDNTIQLRSRIVLKKAIFSPEDYETLRNFYSYVVKKQSEMIVFKKE